LNLETARQYQREEQVLMLQRAAVTEERLSFLLREMSADPLSPLENLEMLRESLAVHYDWPEFLDCGSMGGLVRESLAAIRVRVRDQERATPFGFE
jgi:hypothetical protein